MIKKLFKEKSQPKSEQTEAAAVERYFIDILKHDNADFILCDICKHYVPCAGKQCEYYCEGNEVTIANTAQKVNWHWTCEDFNYGDCPAREDYCYQCIDNGYDCFAWRGLNEGSNNGE